jgi:hypothetical protein
MAPNSCACQAIVSGEYRTDDGIQRAAHLFATGLTVRITLKDVFLRMTKHTLDLEVGQRYRNARLPAFGTSLQIVWLLEQVWQGADGITYARLVKDADATEKKTASAGVLQDRRQFIQVPE